MRGDDTRAAEASGASRRTVPAARPQRPWLLVAAALLFALLSGLLWTKWRDSRLHADQLEAELKQVYAEAEALRTQAMHAQQRAEQLERELRSAAAAHAGPRDRRPKSKSR